MEETPRSGLVLIVDDESQNRRVLAKQLTADGFKVCEAESGTQALELLAIEPVDVILLDVVMPEMDGIDVTRCIKSDPALRDIPIIVLTGSTDTGTRMRALQAGAEEFLGRPVDRLEMVVRLRNLLRLRHASQELSRQNARLAELLANQEQERTRIERELHETVSKLEESRQQVMHAQKMESIGRLAGGVAHDFNNLLTSIICFTRFVVDDMAQSDPRRQDLVEVLKAADSAARLTNQLLAFSRRRPIQPVVLDINKALANVDRVLRRTLGENIEVVLIPSEDPMCALLDAGQFDQLIFNLAFNARDAMPGGGAVTIRVQSRELVDYEGLSDGEYIEIVVSDNGQGMTSEVVSRAFEPFFTTKGDKGTGLGLATCYGIVQQAGGTITVRSEAGSGATFTVLFARVQEGPTQDARGTHNYPDLGLSGTVLVIEDQPAILRTMSRAFKAAGLDVLEARSAEDALSVLSKPGQRLDLVVTDVMLPGMSGPNLIERLRADRPSLRVVFVSGYAGDDAEHAIRSDDRTAFVPKPFTGRQLVFRAAALLGDRPRVQDPGSAPVS